MFFYKWLPWRCFLQPTVPLAPACVFSLRMVIYQVFERWARPNVLCQTSSQASKSIPTLLVTGLVISSFLVVDVRHSNAGASICHSLMPTMTVVMAIRWRPLQWFSLANIRSALVITGGDERNKTCSRCPRSGLCLWRHWVPQSWPTAVNHCILSWQHARMGLSGECLMLFLFLYLLSRVTPWLSRLFEDLMVLPFNGIISTPTAFSFSPRGLILC